MQELFQTKAVVNVSGDYKPSPAVSVFVRLMVQQDWIKMLPSKLGILSRRYGC